MKTLFILLLLLLTTQAQETPTLEDSFREALYAEEVDGDPEAALESYRQLTEQFQKQRTLAARTLYRQAECLRKLDRRDEAVTTYQTLLTRYPENQNLAQLAQENLTALGQEPASPALPAIIDPEDQKIAELKKLLKESPDLLNTGPLLMAAQQSQLKVATFLLDSGADVSRGHGGSDTPLQVAANGGHQAMCELLIERGANIQLEGPGALRFALIHGHQTIIQYLLSLGLVPHSSHLSQAVGGHNDPKSLTQLLNALPESKKAAILNPTLEDAPLFAALEGSPKSIPLLKLLLEHGADPDQISRDHKLSPLAFLVNKIPNNRLHKITFTMMETLLSNGADPNLRSGEDSSSPLAQIFRLQKSYSLTKVPDQAIQTLLDAGADWNKAEPSLLVRTIELNDQKWFDSMIEAGVLDTYPKEEKQKAIDTAVRTANPTALKTLLEQGLQLNEYAVSNLTRNLFVRYEHKQHKNSEGKIRSSRYRLSQLPENAANLFLCLDLVLATKPNLTPSNKHDPSPLQLLIDEGFDYHPEEALQTLRKLLAAGADPNYQTSSNDSLPLSLALGTMRHSGRHSTHNYTDGSISAEVVKTLLEAGADPKPIRPLEKGRFLDEDGDLRSGAVEAFPLLWHALHFDSKNNLHRPNGLWLSQGLSAIKNKQEPAFRCLFSTESAVSSVTLKDFVHRANLEGDRHLDLSGDQPLVIHRLDQADPTSILFRKHLASGEELPLQWGDIIEIPARPSDSELPDDEVITFLQTLRPMDLTVTLAEGQILTNADNATGPIFRYQPKFTQDTIERVRIVSGIAPIFLDTPLVLRPNPDTGELNPTNTAIVLPGDRIHFSVQKPQPGPVTHSANNGKICQNLDGPFWEFFTQQIPDQFGFRPSNSLDWLPQEGLASYLLALAQPHGLPLQPIDWQQAHVFYKPRNTNGDGERFALKNFFASPPENQANASVIIVLPPAAELSPFPEDLKKLLTETLSTPWSLKIGMEDPTEQQWSPRFPTSTQKEDTIIWQAPLPDQQTAPALPLVPDLLEAHPQVPFNYSGTTLFPSQKLIRIDLNEKEESRQPIPTIGQPTVPSSPPRRAGVRRVPVPHRQVD